MSRNAYTAEETKAIKEAVRNYKLVGDNTKWIEFVAKLQSQFPNRTFTALKTKFYVISRGVVKVKKSKMIVRGSKKFTPKGLEALRKSGSQQWGRIKTRLGELGLSDEQIAYAFAKRQAKLTKDIVALIEKTLDTKSTILVAFVFESGKVKATLVPEVDKTAKTEVDRIIDSAIRAS